MIDLGFYRIEQTIDWGLGLGLEAEGREEYRREDGRLHTVLGVAAKPIPVGITSDSSYQITDPASGGGGPATTSGAGLPNFVAIGYPTVLIG